jgi:hypothetical protein
VELKSFETGANKVEGSIKRMADSLSGVKVIQEARIMAAAIEKIGGVTKLTDAEMKKFTATMGAAADKMKALGGGGEGIKAFQAAITTANAHTSDSFRNLFTNVQKTSTATNAAGDSFRKLFTTAPAQVKALDAAVTPLPGVLGRVSAAATAVGGALGVAFTGAAILSAIKSQVSAALNYADALTNLSAATGVSVQGLQRMEAIGVTAGVTMETLARSVNMLQRNLDDKDAQKALRQMGLDYAAIRKLAPEDQFLAISKAVSAIKDPIERANAGAALFGRTWTEIAPAINKDIDKILKNTKTMSDEQIKALDEAGDKWDEFGLTVSRTMKGFVADILLGDKAMDEADWIWNQKSPEIVLPTVKAPTARIANGPTVNHVDPKMISDLKVYGMTLEETIKKTEANTKAQKDAIEAAKKVDESLERIRYAQFRLGESALVVARNVAGFGIRLSETVGISHDYSKAMNAAQVKTNALGITAKVNLEPSLRGIGGAAHQAGLSIGNSVTRFGVAKDALVDFKDEWLNFDKVMGNVAKGFLQNIGSMLSGGLMALVGKGLEAVWGGLKKVFKIGTEESTKVSPLREEFFRMAGGLEKLNPQVMALTGNLTLVQAVFNARTVKDYNAALEALNSVLERNKRLVLDGASAFDGIKGKMADITVITPDLQAAIDRAFEADTAGEFLQSMKDINTEIDKQEQTFNDISGALAKYKIPVSEASDPIFNAQVINKGATELKTDFDNLRKSGIDINVQMRAMGPSINQFVKDAKRAGVEVPRSMQQIIQTAIDAGEVFDTDGKKIGNMEELGLTFGDTMETVMTVTIPDAIGKLTLVLEALAKFFGITLPGAAEDGVGGINDALRDIEVPEINIPINYDVPKPRDFPDAVPNGGGEYQSADGAASGGLVGANGIQRFANGGRVLNFQPRGTDTVPAMLTPGEVVLNAAQQRNLAGAIDSSTTQTFYINTIDAKSFEELLEKRGIPFITKNIRDNRNRARTDMREAIGVTA